MVKLPQYEILLRKAKSDLKLVVKNIGDDEIDGEQLLFHQQQCAEKLLKALLSFNQVHYPKTHDIELLILLANEHQIDLPDGVEELIELTHFAVEFRYHIYEETGKHLAFLNGFVEFVERTLTH